MPSSHLILCRPFSSCPQSLPASESFPESTLLMRWPKYWNFSFSTIPSKEHPGLISFRMDWLHLLAVQGTFKSLLQHHSSKASILQHSAFFIIQLSYPYTTTPSQMIWWYFLWEDFKLTKIDWYRDSGYLFFSWVNFDTLCLLKSLFILFKLWNILV